MVKPHPSIALVFDIDESIDTKDVRLELKRCYSHISSTTVIRSHPTDEALGVQNTLRVLLKFGTRQYLHRSEEADELWTGVIEQHLVNDFGKIANNMQIYNRRQREEETTEIQFDWLELELQGGELLVRFHLDSESSLPAERAAMVSTVRTLFDSGDLGEGVQRVSIPSLDAYKQQLADYEAGSEERARLAAEEEAARLAEEEAAREAAEAEAEENFLESPAIEEQVDEETIYHKQEIEFQQAAEERYRLKDPDFVLDCRLWNVEYADGSARVYDSENGAFQEQELTA